MKRSIVVMVFLALSQLMHESFASGISGEIKPFLWEDFQAEKISIGSPESAVGNTSMEPGVPAGRYQASCQQCSRRGNLLACHCSSVGYLPLAMTSSNLDLSLCEEGTEITLSLGKLQCQAKKALMGSEVAGSETATNESNKTKSSDSKAAPGLKPSTAQIPNASFAVAAKTTAKERGAPVIALSSSPVNTPSSSTTGKGPAQAAASVKAPLPATSKAAGADPSACSPAKQKEALAQAISEEDSVQLDCNLTLKPTDVITKIVDFYGPAASGVTLDCKGGSINSVTPQRPEGRRIVRIRPSKVSGQWIPPENITVKNCTINGSTRIWWGDRENSTGPEIFASSRLAEHTAYMQKHAPKGILFQNITFRGSGIGNIFYFGPGVTNSAVVNSRFIGETKGGAIYLESESANNTIKNNVFDIVTSRREIISVDASARNKIINNTFHNLTYGGIFLYRNCGELGVIRHLSPDENIIVNNVFDYSTTPTVYSKKYGIFLASRDGTEHKFCKDNEDGGYPYGSSADNSSPARHNIVAQNRFIGRSPAEMLVNASEFPNALRENEQVKSAPERLAGCFVKGGAPKDFVPHGATVKEFLIDGARTCTGEALTCSDGEWSNSQVQCAEKKAKNICFIELNGANRLAVRNENGTSIANAYFASNERAKAENKLKELIASKVCDAAITSPVVTTTKAPAEPKPTSVQKCWVELNAANRLVVRSEKGKGLAYFAPSQKKAAEAELKRLIAAKTCQKR